MMIIIKLHRATQNIPPLSHSCCKISRHCFPHRHCVRIQTSTPETLQIRPSTQDESTGSTHLYRRTCPEENRTDQKQLLN